MVQYQCWERRALDPTSALQHEPRQYLGAFTLLKTQKCKFCWMSWQGGRVDNVVLGVNAIAHGVWPPRAKSLQPKECVRYVATLRCDVEGCGAVLLGTVHINALCRKQCLCCVCIKPKMAPKIVI